MSKKSKNENKIIEKLCKNKEFISAVIYVHNNEKCIKEFLLNINDVLNRNFEHYEIILGDDYSKDNSKKVIKEACEEIQESMVSIISMSYYQGLEFAMNAGVDLSIGDFVFEFDNIIMDYDSSLIMDVYKKCLQGNDIVSTSPKNKRRFSSRVFYSIFNKYSKKNNKIDTESFRILSRRTINRVNSLNKSIPYRKAIYANCGLKIATISYTPTNKNKTYISKEITSTRKDVALDSIILFTDFASKFATLLSFIMAMFVLGTLIYTVTIFIGGNPIEGWTTIMLLLSIAFFGIFAILVIIGILEAFFSGILVIIIKYLSVIMNLIFKKQNYLIESIEKITK